MNLVLKKLREEKKDCDRDISQQKRVIKQGIHNFVIRQIYYKSLRKSEKYRKQLESATSILKERYEK